MATVQETQDFLDELDTPSTVTPSQVRDAVKNFVAGGAKLDEQVSRLDRLLQAAEITEPDEELAGMFPEGSTKLGALQREAGKATKALREVVKILDELGGWKARVESRASDLGYTV